MNVKIMLNGKIYCKLHVLSREINGHVCQNMVTMEMSLVMNKMFLDKFQKNSQSLVCTG